MTGGGIKQTELLGELHREPDTVSMIRAALDRALEHDAEARRLRQGAGRMLAKLRAEKPETWLHDAGIDNATAKLLLAMGSGRG